MTAYIFVVDYTEDKMAPTITHFLSYDSFLEWVQDNKERKIAVFKGKCILDWS